VLIILPFALLVGYGAAQLFGSDKAILPHAQASKDIAGSLAAGLAIVMWNYLGWDQLSTIAEEVDKPEKAYPRAIFIGVPLVALIYFLPVLIGLAFYPSASNWSEGAWPDIANAVGGKWLSIPMSIAAIVSPIALFTSSVLATSRVPFVMAEDGFLPGWFVHIDRKWGTPVRSILFASAIYAILAFRNFTQLVELNVVMYCAALTLESGALIALRIKEPNLHRPFKIPGGYPVLVLIFLLPVGTAVTMAVYSILEETWTVQLPSIIALASGPIALAVVLLFRRSLK